MFSQKGGHLSEAVRYGLAGVLNTVIGFGVFLIAHHLLGFSPAIANAAGYAFGLVAAFFLNRYFVFRRGRTSLGAAVRFGAAVAAAFLVNQGLLAGLLGIDGVSVAMAQIGAMAGYTLSLYAICRAFIYRREA